MRRKILKIKTSVEKMKLIFANMKIKQKEEPLILSQATKIALCGIFRSDKRSLKSQSVDYPHQQWYRWRADDEEREWTQGRGGRGGDC